MHHHPHNILLVNPWIHDFAAYDFWARPLGLLSLASILRSHGFAVTYIDCLDRFHPRASPQSATARSGRGPYLKTRIARPQGMEDVNRHFSRYGIKKKWFYDDLASIPQPALILVSSMMTYQYPGTQETIAIIKDCFPDTPVILGGVYTTLCYEHAVRHSGADYVYSGACNSGILKLAADIIGLTNLDSGPQFDSADLDSYPYPSWELQQKFGFVPLLTSTGCPFACVYCASRYLNPSFQERSSDAVVSEIIFWHKNYNIKDFVFYDDALLVNAGKRAIPIMEQILNARLKLRFHTPNAIHIREITALTAKLMFKAGFKTIRLGLESALFKDRQKLDNKVTDAEFQNAVLHLKAAGFHKNQVGAYLLAGLPGQPLHSIEASVKLVKKSGVSPILAYYTPIPHTALWDEAVNSSRYDLEADPLFTNNAIFPCQERNFSWEVITYLKNLIAE
ncbi:radical SAM protein [Desulfococcaceae bacterium HSG9]|nr:radical SAM protein [Desulfococcaceae bacterium HSG9]